MVERLRSAPLFVGVALGATTLALYLYTLAPTITWGWNGTGVDGGEFLAAADNLGVPHPPGYPTYVLLLKAFATVVPVGDFAYRGNLLSAILAAAAVVAVYWVSFRLCRSIARDAPAWQAAVGSGLGGAVLAASPLFWSQAIITEVYALNALFAGALLVVASYLALPTSDGRGTGAHAHLRGLAVFGFLLGIGLGNHLTLLAIALPLCYWLAVSMGWRALLSAPMMGAFVLGLAVYFYLPIRAAANPPVNWGSADTVTGAVWMLTARPYQEYVFGVQAGDIVARLVTWTELAFTQFNPLGLFFGLIGLAPLRSRAPGFFVASLIGIVLISVYSVTFSSVDFEVLMIPAFLLFSIWLGVGSFWMMVMVARAADRSDGAMLGGRLRVRPVYQAASLGALGFLLLPVVSVALNIGTQNLRDDRTAYAHASGLLDSVPDGSVLLADTERDVFSLWYLSQVERPERDVAVISIRLMQFDWYLRNLQRAYPARIPAMPVAGYHPTLGRIVEHNLGGPGVFVTFGGRGPSGELDLERVGKVWRVGLKPGTP